MSDNTNKNYDYYYGNHEYRTANSNGSSTHLCADHWNLLHTIDAALVPLYGLTNQTSVTKKLIKVVNRTCIEELDTLLAHAHSQGDDYLVPGKDYNLIHSPKEDAQ